MFERLHLIFRRPSYFLYKELEKKEDELKKKGRLVFPKQPIIPEETRNQQVVDLGKMVYSPFVPKNSWITLEVDLLYDSGFPSFASVSGRTIHLIQNY